jgi:hypothetical protein
MRPMRPRRRWHPLVLVTPLALLALLASALMIPKRSMAAAPSPTSFKGKAAVYTSAGPYFVVAFTCSPSAAGTTGTLSGSWTYEDSSNQSFSGTLGSSTSVAANCALVSADGGATWSTSPDGTTRSSLTTTLFFGANNSPVGTLHLFLTAIRATKTYCPDTTVTCPSGIQCIQIDTSVLGSPINSAFHSEDLPGYGTLNLTLPKR